MVLSLWKCLGDLCIHEDEEGSQQWLRPGKDLFCQTFLPRIPPETRGEAAFGASSPWTLLMIIWGLSDPPECRVFPWPGPPDFSLLSSKSLRGVHTSTQVHMAVYYNCIYFHLLQAKIAISVAVCSEQQLMSVSILSAAEACRGMELLLGGPAGIIPSWEKDRNTGTQGLFSFAH